jgi:hypothetical protein
MSAYTDTTLINCNRSASVEARTNNNTNPAIFTNPLQQSVQLNVGDKISLERAFISEIGAGNPQTIEFKGDVKGVNKVGRHTLIVEGDFYTKQLTGYNPEYRLGYYRSIRSSEIESEEVELRDNLAPLIFGYYITCNEYPNYIQQPRRYCGGQDTRGVLGTYLRAEKYFTTDGPNVGGAYQSVDENCILEADWTKRKLLNSANASIDGYKQKVDNTRYTLFVKNFVAYTTSVVNYSLQFPTRSHNGIFSEATYHRVRDRIDIEVNKGFNTPSAIAKQITEQLNKTKKVSNFSMKDTTGFIRPITKTIENETYKPINCQNSFYTNFATWDAYKDTDLIYTLPSQLAVDYISTFAYIAVKRPEIWETGRIAAELVYSTPIIRDINDIILVPQFEGADEGFQVYNEDITIGADVTENTFDEKIIINVEFNQYNLNLIRELFDAEILYPELWTSLPNTVCYSETRTKNAILTEENTRFFHMNKHTNDTNTAIHNDAFGDDAFVERAAPNNINMASLPIFIKWENDTRDTYIEPSSYTSYTVDGLVYGFAMPYKVFTGEDQDTLYLIQLSPDLAGGIPREFFTETTNTKIKRNRRIGFDQHATAYSTAVITPHSGYTFNDMGTQIDGGVGLIQRPDGTTLMPSIGSDYANDISPYQTQTYIGANNPALSYNAVNNRFEFSRLHTANNIGNKLMSGCQLGNINNETLIPPNLKLAPPPINADAADTCYKITPRPPQFGYSPTFLPYNRYNQAYRQGLFPLGPEALDASTDQANTQLIEAQNLNIEPFNIFDSHGGIYIDNLGIPEGNWEDSLWDILGFNYDSLNAVATKDNVLTQRITPTNENSLYRPTTNGEIVATDGKALVTNRYGANMYYTGLPYPINIVAWIPTFNGVWNLGPVDTPTGQALSTIPEVVIRTQSTTITATDLQKSVLKPYYTIRSSILEGASAIGGNPTGSQMAIISVIDKYSAQGDYFFGNPSDIQFTITKNCSIADITTSIHDPDGEFANVDRTSAVIYKIEKLKDAPINIIQELLKQNKK